MEPIRIALIQMPVAEDVSVNLAEAADRVREASKRGLDFAVLPEMFACPYNAASFVKNKEPRGGRIWTALSRMAAENHIYLIGGSFPEEDGENIYNSCFIFDPSGNEIGRHRKIHLFDIDVAGGQSFHESETFTGGNDMTVIDTAFGRIGVEICFDIRFQELTRLMALDGARIIFVPAAFNMTTGPMHWETHFRGRALDNQLFMLGCAPARDEKASYVSYGNSIAVSPWGQVIGRLQGEAGTLFVNIDPGEIDAVRSQIPILSARRTDLYETKALR